MSTNREELLEELDALEAIYPDCLERKLNDSSIIQIKVPQHERIILQISFPPTYPSDDSPSVLEVRSLGDANRNTSGNKELLCKLQELMTSVYHKGSVCLFDFLTELDNLLYAGDIEEPVEDPPSSVTQERNLQPSIDTDPFANWSVSEPITDRGSTFIGYATRVNSEEEAFAKLESLRSNSKFKKCAHVMSAWRIKVTPTDGGREITYQDFDDDGETAAGSRMLHLLTIMDTWNVVVVVARWFGGTLLGPDRFKHINTCAREAVVRAGLGGK